MNQISPYLNRPLRSEATVLAQRQLRAVQPVQGKHEGNEAFNERLAALKTENAKE